MPKQVTVTLTLAHDQALGLAQFVKRADRDCARRHAGDDREADAIYESWIVLRESLAEAGFAPR